VRTVSRNGDRRRAEPFCRRSAEEFIAQHYWSYAKQKNGSSVGCRVDHPVWRIWRARSARLERDFEQLYGEQFAQVLCAMPSSGFLAEGSAITVYRGMKIV